MLIRLGTRDDVVGGGYRAPPVSLGVASFPARISERSRVSLRQAIVLTVYARKSAFER